MSTSDKTYEVLPGASDNAGGRYEYLMSSYAALNLLQSSASNFQISLNSKKFGKFDDIVVEILQNGITTESWAVQLKHSANKKAITTRELGAATGAFSLKMYFEDYQQQQHMAKPILFTNKVFREGASIQIEETPYVLTSRKSSAACPFNTSKDGGVFQFDIQGQAAGDDVVFKSWQTFLDTFCICANQESVDQLDQDVSRLFATALGFVEDEKYKKFFEKYWEKKPVNGKKDKLQREEIEREVARIVLGPYAGPTIASKVNSAEEDMLKTIISQFDVTLIDADCGTLVANLWQLSDGDIPSIVTVSEAKADSIYNVLNVLKTGTYKFVLVGGDCLDPNKLSNWKVLENLSNLESGDYKTITGKFSCVVQGRKTTCLAEILKDNEKLNEVIKIGHLLRMADDNKPFVIGDDTVKLPKPYIERSVRKHVFSCDLIGNLTRDDVLVISCGNLNKLLKMVKKHKHDTTKIIDITNRDFINEPVETSPLILISKDPLREFSKICLQFKDEKTVLNFDFVNNSLNLLSSRGKLTHFKSFHEKNTDQIVNESEIVTSFVNKMNVLLADPGMGKTVCADFIKQNCPFDFWPVKINLREKLSLFTTCANVQDLLAKILDQSDFIKPFQEYYINDKQLMLIWDGLDEVGNENVDLVMSKIQEISDETRHRQCITSRCHLQKQLESFFDVLSITLTEVTPDDQRNYIKKGLVNIYPINKIDGVTENIHKRIVESNLKDMLGIPLLLNMFTAICSEPDNYKKIQENELSLTQIYGIFIDSKFDNHFKEKSPSGENTLLLKMHRKLAALHMINYPKAALITCFGRYFFEKFDLNCDDFVRDIANDGDEFGLITIITDNNTPIFLHKTFAEYFAALYLSKELEKLGSEILNQLLFRPEHRNIRFLFDMCLSENLPAHQAVLAMNLDKLKEIAEKDKDMILSQDEGGRNVLHLACSYGTSRMPLKPLDLLYIRSYMLPDKGEFEIFDATPLHSLEKENRNYEDIVKYLVSVADQKTIKDIDKIYGLNCFEYADASLSLYAIESLLKNCQVKNEVKHFLRNYKDTESLIAYSIVLNYENLLSVLNHIPYFELFREKHNFGRQLLLDIGFEHLSNYNILILIIEFGGIDLFKKALENHENVKRMKERTHLVLWSTSVMYEIDSLVWAVKKGKFDIFKLLFQEPYLQRRYGMREDDILHIAIELCQKEIVKYIVSNKLTGIDINNKYKGNTLLIDASTAGDLDIVIYLIETGAKVDATNIEGQNVLHIACEKGHIKLVEYFVQNNKILLKKLDKNKKTPLLTAAEMGRFDIVKYLQENGANFKTNNKSKRNILHYACSEGTLSFIKSLTKEDLIELNMQDCDGYNPILLAASKNRFDIVKYLQENGANFKTNNKSKRNILHYACSEGNLSFIKSLTKRDLIELDMQDCNGCNPLLLAASKNRFDIVKYLLEIGANFKTNNKSKENVLHYACSEGNLSFIRSLTKRDLIDLNTQDCNGDTPIYLAASENHFDIVEYLQEIGISFQTKPNSGRNVLHYACLKGDSAFIKKLTKTYLIELNTKDCNGDTPMLLAASENHFDIVEYLQEIGISFETKTNSGRNVLHYACLKGDSAFIKKLTKAYLIELNTKDCNGDTPMLLAASENHFDIVEYLLEIGTSINAHNKNDQNLLHCACSEGNLVFIKSLGRNDLHMLDTQDCEGLNPLLLAASKNRFDIVEHLLKNGAYFKITYKTKGYSLVHFAAEHGVRIEFFKSCLSTEDWNTLSEGPAR